VGTRHCSPILILVIHNRQVWRSGDALFPLQFRSPAPEPAGAAGDAGAGAAGDARATDSAADATRPALGDAAGAAAIPAQSSARMVERIQEKEATSPYQKYLVCPAVWTLKTGQVVSSWHQV
jgi:hypothetical protein